MSRDAVASGEASREARGSTKSYNERICTV